MKTGNFPGIRASLCSCALLRYLILLSIALFSQNSSLAVAQSKKPASLIPGHSTVVFPILAPKVSSGYGFRIHPIRKFSIKHQGVDLAVPENSHVRSIMAGQVVFADKYAGYGKLVTVSHGLGRISMYGHLSEFLVNVGDQVPAGALLGRVGSTGSATGPHLHFEWRVQGTSYDPLSVFPFLASSADG